jgi:hypothetical protein
MPPSPPSEGPSHPPGGGVTAPQLDDLDDDWRWLLADLDKRLIK